MKRISDAENNYNCEHWLIPGSEFGYDRRGFVLRILKKGVRNED